jgi:hypothetical protein
MDISPFLLDQDERLGMDLRAGAIGLRKHDAFDVVKRVVFVTCHDRYCTVTLHATSQTQRRRCQISDYDDDNTFEALFPKFFAGPPN